MLAFFVLVVGILFWMWQRQEKFAAESQPLQDRTIDSQSSSLMQSGHPAPSPSSFPTTTPSPPTANLGAPLPSPMSLPGHSNTPSASSMAPSSLQMSHSPQIADQRAQQPGQDLRIDARSSGSKIVFNICSRHWPQYHYAQFQFILLFSCLSYLRRTPPPLKLPRHIPVRKFLTFNLQPREYGYNYDWHFDSIIFYLQS